MGRHRACDSGGNNHQRREIGATKSRSLSFRCRECGTVRYVAHIELRRAARPRCLACGGTLEETAAEEKRLLGTPTERKQKAARLRQAIADMKAMPFQCQGCGLRCEQLLRLVAHVHARPDCRDEYRRQTKPLPEMPK